MKSIRALRERHTALATEVRDLVAKDEKWSPEKQAKYDQGMAEIDDIKAEIARIEAVEAALGDLSDSNELLKATTAKVKKVDAAVRAVFDKWARNDDRQLSAQDWETIRNTMSTTTGSEGGYTVPVEIAKSVAEALKSLGGMRAVGTVIQSSDGVDMNFPTSDGTAEEGEIVAQNAPANDQDATFGTVLIPTYKYSSKVVTVPYELLQDSSIDIDRFVTRRLDQRVWRITNKHFTIGTGTGQPKGIDIAATLGKQGTTGQTTTVIVDDLIDMVHSVDNAYRDLGNCRWMMHDSSLKVIRKLKDSQGRPIFLPGYDGLAGPMPDTLLGYPITINNHMPVMAASAKSILFGDFSYYVIRDVVSSYVIQRYDDSPYAKKGQRGFHLWARAGGNFTDVGGAVKYYQNSAS